MAATLPACASWSIASASCISPPAPGFRPRQHLKHLGREHIAPERGKIRRRLTRRWFLDHAIDGDNTVCIGRARSQDAVFSTYLSGQLRTRTKWFEPFWHRPAPMRRLAVPCLASGHPPATPRTGCHPPAGAAHSTAWPRPSGSGWRTKMHETPSGTMLRTMSRKSVFAFGFQLGLKL